MRPAGVETAALDAENRGDERAPAAPRQHRRDSLLLFVACTLMWTANSMYLINMPLYVVHELRLPERLAGILMGAAAGLEIPIMLLAGLAAKHCGKRRLMRGRWSPACCSTAACCLSPAAGSSSPCNC